MDNEIGFIIAFGLCAKDAAVGRRTGANVLITPGSPEAVHRATNPALGHRRRGVRGCGRSGRFVAVHQILQLFARLEVGDTLGGNLNSRACLGIAADACLPLARAKAAESADLDLVAAAQ